MGPPRAVGTAALGLVIAVAVGAIWRTPGAPRPGSPLEGLGRGVIGAGAGALVLAGAPAAGLAWLQVRPCSWPGR